MNSIDLEIAVASGQKDFSDITFDINVSLNSLDISGIEYIKFINCTFNEEVEIESIIDNKFRIAFHKCIFNNDIKIYNCEVNTIGFYNIQDMRGLEILHLTAFVLQINSQSTLDGAIIDIDDTSITEHLNFSRLNIVNGSLSVNINSDDIELVKNPKVILKNSNLSNAKFNGNFGSQSDFSNFKVDMADFRHCQFQRVIFENTNFGNTFFYDCKFLSTTSFKNSFSQKEVGFTSCIFTGFAHFNESNFNDFNLTHVTFENKVSFDRLNVNTISIYQVSFLQGAFFDELKIHKITNNKFINSWTPEIARQWRRTLRLIKQELQKAENKIDYNRFRGYELSAYYQELDWKWNSEFKDKAILGMTKIVTGFDHSWRKALRFTLISSFIFFTLFFISENYFYPIDLSFYTEFLSGSFRFLLVTDFYNPLSDGRNYIDSTNTIGWFIFILGKIVIAFGIYEMIQAFRKFKA